MGEINFSGVEEAKERVMTTPGTIGVFSISNVEFGTTKNKGTYYMGVTFTRKEDEFQHSFFLSEKALPRVKSLVKHASGVELDTSVHEEKLITLLKGRNLAMKVTARFDDENGRAYPNLPFGGFCKAPERVGELSFSKAEQDDIKRAEHIRQSGATARPEATPSTEFAVPDPGADKPASDEVF